MYYKYLTKTIYISFILSFFYACHPSNEKKSSLDSQLFQIDKTKDFIKKDKLVDDTEKHAGTQIYECPDVSLVNISVFPDVNYNEVESKDSNGEIAHKFEYDMNVTSTEGSALANSWRFRRTLIQYRIEKVEALVNTADNQISCKYTAKHFNQNSNVFAGQIYHNLVKDIPIGLNCTAYNIDDQTAYFDCQ